MHEYRSICTVITEFTFKKMTKIRLVKYFSFSLPDLRMTFAGIKPVSLMLSKLYHVSLHAPEALRGLDHVFYNIIKLNEFTGNILIGFGK